MSKKLQKVIVITIRRKGWRSINGTIVAITYILFSPFTQPPVKSTQEGLSKDTTSSTSTDQDGFKVPPPPGFKPYTKRAQPSSTEETKPSSTESREECMQGNEDNREGRIMAPPPGYKRAVTGSEETEPPGKKLKGTSLIVLKVSSKHFVNWLKC